jgi:CHAT domain-containing protein
MLRMLIVALLGLSYLAPVVADEPKPQWQRMLTGEDAKKAAELEKRTQDFLVLGNHLEAIRLQEELLALRTKVQGADHWETVDQKWNLMFLKILVALPREKRTTLNKAFEGMVVAADRLEKQAQFASAMPFLQEGLKCCQEILGENSPKTIAAYGKIAFNLHYQGKYTEGMPFFQKALDIAREIFGENHPYTAKGYNNMALSFSAQGNLAEAHAFLMKSLDIDRRVHGESHLSTAQGYANLAGILDQQGKYAEAALLYRYALSIYYIVKHENHLHMAFFYNNAAVNLDHLRKYDEAALLYQNALDVYRGLKIGDHPNAALTYSNLAFNLDAQGQYAKAAPFHRKSLDIYRKHLGENHPHTAGSASMLACHLDAQREHAEASPLHQQTLDIARRVGGEHGPDTARRYNYLAFNLHALENYTAAMAALEAGARSYEAARLTMAATGLERSAFGAERSPYEFLGAARSRAGRSAEAWAALEANLARGLLDEMALTRDIDLTPAEQRQRDELRTQRAPLDSRIVALLSQAGRTAAEATELDELIKKRQELENSLGALAVAVSGRKLASLAQVQMALLADSAFVGWVDVSDKSGDVQEHWGCVVGSNGDPHWERLPGSGLDGKWTKEDTELPARFRHALANFALPSEIHALANKLEAQRIAPLSKHLAGVKRLYIAPVNQMAGIPIEALTDRYTVSYTPSGTYLARLKDRERPCSTGVLAVGDPTFPPAKEAPQPTALPPGGLLITQVVPGGNAAKARLQSGDVLLSYAGTDLTSVEQLGKLIEAQSGAKSVVVKVWREGQEKLNEREVAPDKLDVVLAKEPAREAITARRQMDQMLAKLSRGEDYAELPGTQVEIARVAELFDGKNVTTLTRADATEQRLEAMRKADELKKFRYLHFATHGKADNFRSFDSTLILTRPEKIPEPRAGEPWLDGRLTAAEVLEYWKLDAELVTLSACESALGRQGGGDGLLGFAQAFLLAGSRSVCLTLWQVDDTATVLLMDRFYRNLLGKREDKAKPRDKAAALHEAKHWLRNLTATEALERLSTLTDGVVRGERPARMEKAVPIPKDAGKDYKPYSHPRYWAAFILIGDPE